MLAKLINTLQSGGVVCFPTDTVYALASLADKPQAVRRLFEIKQRDHKKPFAVLVKDVAMAKQLVVFDKRAEQLAEAFWPGALTLVLPIRDKKIDPLIHAGTQNLGVRVAGHMVTRGLFEDIDVPIVASSANISGQLSESFEEVKQQADYVFVDGVPGDQASTVVGLTTSYVEMLRVGEVACEQIAEVLGGM